MEIGAGAAHIRNVPTGPDSDIIANVERLHALDPALAHRHLELVDREAARRHARHLRASDQRRERMRLTAAVLVVIACLVAAVVLVVHGQPAEGCIVGTVNLAVIAAVFLDRRRIPGGDPKSETHMRS